MTGDEHTAPVFRDALFRQRCRHGAYRLVRPPRLEREAVDTHAHVHLLADPALELARCAVHGVSFVCDVVDVCEDDPAVFERLDGWREEAAALAPELLEASRAVVRAGGNDRSALPQDAAARELLPAEGGALVSPRLRLAVGCHPHNARLFDDAAEAALRARLADPRVCAVGEVGLDYHYDLSPRDEQRQVFRRQIRIAHETGLPLALHVREAHDEALAILKEEGFPAAGTLLHCFDLGWGELKPWLDEGCLVALGGALTFSRCEDTRQAVARVPVERLLTETDAPYMTPEPMRGMPCGPAHVAFTAARMAQVRGCAPGEGRAALLEQLRDNALALLDRPPTAWQRAQARP